MARTATMKPPAPKGPSLGLDEPFPVMMTRRKIMAIDAIFRHGLTAATHFNLIPNTTTAEAGMNDLRKAAAAVS